MMWRKILGISALLTLVAAITGTAVVTGVSRWGVRETVSERDTSESPPADVPLPDSPVVEKFCSTCHRLPPPDCEPRHLWAAKIKEMYGYAQKDRVWPESQMPPIEEPIAYFTARAPLSLTLPDDAMGSPPSPLAFERHMIALDEFSGPPAVSNVQFVQLSEDGARQLIVCDMQNGLVALWTPSRPTGSVQVLARIPHPSRTTVVDLDQDGIRDILVANLGIFWPDETDQGSVVWLRGRADGQFEPVVLLDGLGRVNEARAADFDGDGDLDIIVAVFGNFTTGMIIYMENFTEDYSEPDFEPISIDGRTGTSDIPLVDLNGDGRTDFIALQSQQHEHVIAFLNNGRGRFRTEQIYAAPHTRWGSTGIKLIDMDGDGDIDLLYNHGDAFQVPPILRPYHGFGWLENPGKMPFIYHRLAHLPGAHTSHPCDLDGDGDTDIISSMFIPAIDPDWPDTRLLDTVIWLEQTEPGEFKRYRLEGGAPMHPCLDAGDYDGDGDVDIVLGNFVVYPFEGYDQTPCLTVLENLSAGPDPNPGSRDPE